MHLHAHGCSCIACPQARNTPRPQARNTPPHTKNSPTVRRPATATKATTSITQAAAPPRGERGQDKETKNPRPPPRQRSGFSNSWPFGPHRILPWVGQHKARGSTRCRAWGRRGTPAKSSDRAGCSAQLLPLGAQNKCFGNIGRPPQGQVPKTPCFVSSRGSTPDKAVRAVAALAGEHGGTRP